jgi:tetratricopeptide (TPR) repeat protein
MCIACRKKATSGPVRQLLPILGLGLAVLAAACRPPTEARGVQPRLAQAEQLLHDNRPRDAVRVLERALEGGPDAAVSGRLGVLYAQLGDWKRAAVHLERAGNVQTDVALGSLLALSLAASGDAQGARKRVPRHDDMRPGSELGLLVAAALAREPGDQLPLRQRLWAWRDRHDESAPAELHAGVGALSFTLGDAPSARAAYAAVRSARLADASWAAGLARVHVLQGHPVPARALLERLVALHPEHQEAWLRLAELAVAEGDAALLRRALARLPVTKPEPDGIRLLQARALWLEQRPAAALERLGTAQPLGTAPLAAEQVELELLRVRCALEAGRLGETDARLQMLALRPELALRASALRVELELMRGQLDAAQERAQELTKIQPGAGEAHYWTGRVQAERKAWPAAQAAYRLYLERVPRPDPRRVEVLHRLALATLAEGSASAAQALFETALVEDPDGLEPLKQLQALLPAADAEARLRKQIGLALRSVPARTLLAELLRKQARQAEAEQVYRDALVQEPDDSRGAMAFAAFLREQQRGAEALQVLEAAYARDPEQRTVLAMLANAQAEAGQAARAAELYEQLVTRTPDSVPALNNLAFLYADVLGQPDRALVHAERAQQLAPDWPEVQDTLGWVRLKRGQHAEALELLGRAAERLPKQPSVLYHLGAAQLAAGQRDAGRSTLQRAAQHRGPFPERERVAELLAAK